MSAKLFVKGDLVEFVYCDNALIGLLVLLLDSGTSDLPFRKWLAIVVNEETGNVSQHRLYEHEMALYDRRDCTPRLAVDFVVWDALHSGVDWRTRACTSL